MSVEPNATFPSTRWSRILAPGGRRDLDALARDYARPIRSWLAARMRCSDDRADDLAQDAFAWILTSDLFGKADPARGSFRGLLKRALGNFAIERFRQQNAAKRGGGAVHFDLAEVALPADPRALTPDQVLDETWRRELLQRAQVRLQQELENGPRGTYWCLFRDFFLADGEAPDHSALAARYRITRTDVANWLDYGKRRYRAILRELVRDTVVDEHELQEELRWLFGAGRAAHG